MTQPAINAVTENLSSARSLTQPKSQAWYRPTLSHEHGVYVVLLVSFLTGAALAQGWTLATTLALVCAFLGFQAEHPIVLQIKQRRSLKPRFLVWGGLYSAVSVAIAFWLYLSSPSRTKINFQRVHYLCSSLPCCSSRLRGYHWHHFSYGNGVVGTQHALLFQHHFYRQVA